MTDIKCYVITKRNNTTEFIIMNPHLAQTSGEVEVINENTLLVCLDAKNIKPEEEDESIIMSLFFDFLIKDAIQNPDKLIPYTEEMSTEIDQLLADFSLEEE